MSNTNNECKINIESSIGDWDGFTTILMLPRNHAAVNVDHPMGRDFEIFYKGERVLNVNAIIFNEPLIRLKDCSVVSIRLDDVECACDDSKTCCSRCSPHRIDNWREELER